MSFLEDILTSTRARLAERKAAVTEDVLEQRVAAQEMPRGFTRALSAGSVIAEIKRATPRGELDVDLEARKLAAAYKEGGAAAISVLTEPEYFQGSLEDLKAARSVGLPVLLKDFVLDTWQVFEARAWGADAVLLIVRCVDERLKELHNAVRSLGMDALVEVFSEADVERALDAGAKLIGVNHRDLETFEVDPERTLKLAPMIPSDVTLVGLSGVSDRAGAEALFAAGATAILVGEALVTAADPAGKLKELLGR